MPTFRIVCLGTSPLLFRRMPQDFRIKECSSVALSKGDIASLHLYRNHEGRIVLPAVMLKNRLIAELSGGRTAKEAFQRDFIMEQDVPLRDPRTNQDVSWKVDELPIPDQGRATVPAIRPRIDSWGFSVDIIFQGANADFGKRDLQKAFEKTGSNVGLGWHPPGNSTYGRFRMHSIEGQ